VAAVVLLVSTMVLPELGSHLTGGLGAAVALPVIVVFVAGNAALRRQVAARHGDGAAVARGRHGALARSAVQVVLHLWPVGVLSTIYPLASRHMAGSEVGGVPLTSLLLAVSLTVPWLSQGVCMPLYQALGTLIGEGDEHRLRERFCAVWPAAFVQTLPTVVVFAVPLRLATGWSPTAMTAYVVLCVLTLAFSQSLVLSNIGSRRVGWALAWTAYALPILVFPTAWYLPPILGLLPQLLLMRRHLVARPIGLEFRPVVRDVVRGLLLGAVLWGDKLVYFLSHPDGFAVETVFLALLPAVLAYNYYFIRLAPTFDSSVAALRVAMEKEPINYLAPYSTELAWSVCSSLVRTALTGAALTFVVSWAVIVFSSAEPRFVVGVAVASWFFMMTTIASYKLDYIGNQRLAQALGAAHLLLCVALFQGMPAGGDLYLALAGGEAVLLAIALRACFSAWRVPEYTLFWRHATAW
jgi:hypothetical protein